ncbi:unnamed protein product [Lactuca saligna]|uniref:Uncharacterized protein n=1 Tax=Lactuca saligna TaxID=75948 RepID=A0AA35VM66_LACSI|nr:unnamed protein product [Lactuca saligna]
MHLNHTIMQKVNLLILQLEDQTSWNNFQVTPSKRKFIEVDSEKEFADQISVIRAIACILKTMFDNPWTSWKKVDKEHRDAMWEHFKGLYVWPEATNVLARMVWEDYMKKRFPDIMRRTREESLKLAKAANVNASLEGENNINKLEDGSISKHTGGSIYIHQHKKRMQATLKRPPTGVELYARLHTKRSTQEYITPKAAKVKEAYESAMVAKFGDDTSCHPLLDNETWCDVSGGVKKGRIYGFGSVSDPASFLEGTSSTITSQEVVYERVRNEMRGEMDAKAAEMEAKHQQMREEMDAKAASIDVKQQQIDAKYEAMEKMYAALQNMMRN